MLYLEKKFRKKVTNDTYNNLIFQKCKKVRIYLVGGYVRDGLRNINSKDRDYIIHGNVHKFTKQINTVIKGTTVFFKKSGTIRIVTKEGVTLDFSKLSTTVENDLSKRDFTINAIAWSPSDGIIDLYAGVNDIEKKRIKCISKENLIQDPIRILRAYRFAAELDGYIEKNTRSALKELYRRINTTASERITKEIFHLLNSKNAPKYLLMAFYDNVLNSILMFRKDILRRNILKMVYKEKKYLFKTKINTKINYLQNISEPINYKALLRLSMLLQLKKKPFYRLEHLSVSNQIEKRIAKICFGIHLFNEKKALKEDFYDIFVKIKDVTQDIAILLNNRNILNEYMRFRRMSKRAYLSSHEIMAISGKKCGKELGTLINKVQKAQYMLQVKNKRQAKQLVKDLS
jgi:tRNA nucleotidyltransferase/poly(A) polymerase